MTDIAIRVENLSKQYRIGGPQARYKTIRESLTEAVGAPFRRLSSVIRGQSSAVSNETIWALKDVSFEACPELSRRVQRGEVVGIPSTGSGQALAATGRGRRRLLRQAQYKAQGSLPHHRADGGRAEIHGRVGSLLEVGTGFHPELTGRENIYLNGAIPSIYSGQAWA
jgi:lipopolysaccharide transport system ATP-binding protein